MDERPNCEIMRYWLFKSEPSEWSWEDQIAKGEIGEEWDGIRNYQARNYMQEMNIGDLGFFYHSQTSKTIEGIVEVIATAHQDSTTDDSRWRCVDVKALKSFIKPVSLKECKSVVELSDMVLVNNSRLSVQPVKENEWNIICSMGGIDNA